MTAIELALLERGYQQCANNIHSIPGSLWTPEDAGLLEPARHNEAINVRGDHILILRHTFHGIPYTANARYEHEVVEQFDKVPAMMEWLTTNGRLSEPGMPTFSNSWD